MKQEKKEKELTLEEAFLKLEETVTLLEKEDISLEESFQAYKQGMDIVKLCNETIDKVEKKVLMISEEGGLREF